jgi:hypothetical protein
MMARPEESQSRESRLELLFDLQRQLPRARGPLRIHTLRAIVQLEVELAGGRGVAAREATR